MKKPVFRAFAMLLASVILCVCCSLIAPAIDTPAMRRNARQGALMLAEQGATPQLTGGFKSAQLDNFTSILITKTAAYTGDEPWLTRAFGGLRVDLWESESESGWQAYGRYVPGQDAPDGTVMHYARYWHGYMLPLRILLSVFDLANLQMLLYFAQAALFFLVLAGMKKRELSGLIPGFFLSYFLLMPAASGVCLQFAPVTLITLLACLFILHADACISRAVTLPGFFALTGLLTNYFDLLTAPLLTLLFPLILLLCLRIRGGETLPQLVRLSIFCCAAWGMGYGCMWALKWLLNCLVYGWGHLENIVRQAVLRTSAEASRSRFDALRLNLDVILAKKAYLVLLLAGFMMTLLPAARAVIARRSITPDVRALVLVIPALVPAAWYIVMANHSIDHTYFTYRSAAAIVLAGFALIAMLPAFKDKENA